ncbi:MAG: hypothetical protein WAM42_14710 [Candidatus Nitrosopolaris sp.]|jgi:hypothetical protein
MSNKHAIVDVKLKLLKKLRCGLNHQLNPFKFMEEMIPNTEKRTYLKSTLQVKTDNHLFLN